jgi:anaerobic selenocysteine-containing dehydrogenase
LVILCGLVPDHLAALFERFTEGLGSRSPVFFDLHTAMEGRREALDLSQRWFGTSRLPIYDLSRSDLVFSFGANFLENWMSPVAQGVDFGTMRQGQLGGRGYVVQFEPRLSMTAASADEWIAIEPGMEGLVALGLGRIIVEEDLGQVGSHREHADLYRDINVGEIAESSGVSVEVLQRLARLFAGADRPLAMAGGYLAGFGNAPQQMDAVLALNIVMRRLGREGGVFLPLEVPTGSFSQTISPGPIEELEQVLEQMRAGEVELLLLHHTNPVYELPEWMGVREALDQVADVVSFSPIVDETAVLADWILPDHTYLEGWGYRIVEPGGDRPAVSAQQPVTQPLYDTRATSDVLLSLASSLGGSLADALPWGDVATFLEERSSELLGSSIGSFDARTGAGFWSRWRQFGGWWSDRPIRNEPEVVRSLDEPIMVSETTFAGDAEEYPFYLLPYESVTLTDGRGAHQPWLQEAPDPMTTARWNTWVEVNPQTAERLGVEDNDLVRVRSASGEIEVPVVVYPGIRPDVIAIPVGQGHEDSGRFAAGRGANVVKLLSRVQEQGASLAWGATRVQVESVGRKREIARLESLEGGGRESIR